MTDFYRVLGVQPGASQDEIKVAFRKLALTFHPDRHVSASESKQTEAAARFKAITEAYEVLTDDKKRAQYEASARYGRGSYGASSSSSSSSYGGGGQYTSANTDWARSRYQHTAYAGARLSWFQELQRAVGARKLEAGFGVAAVGLALFGGTLIDAAWSRRNQGRSFEEMQAARLSTAASGAGAGGADGGAGAGPGSARAKPYSPAA